jgi:hypothetical protein
MTKQCRPTKRQREKAERRHKIKVACIGIAIFVVFLGIMLIRLTHAPTSAI